MNERTVERLLQNALVDMRERAEKAEVHIRELEAERDFALKIAKEHERDRDRWKENHDECVRKKRVSNSKTEEYRVWCDELQRQLQDAEMHRDNAEQTCDSFAAQSAVAAEALTQIAQIQRDKCEQASADMLYLLLDAKVTLAEHALASLPARAKAYQEVVEAAWPFKLMADELRKTGAPELQRASIDWAVLQPLAKALAKLEDTP